MKKGLMIEEHSFLNMDSIVQWSFNKESITIETMLADVPAIEIMLIDSSLISGASFRVTKNEFHRIKRQITEYMGVF